MPDGALKPRQVEDEVERRVELTPHELSITQMGGTVGECIWASTREMLPPLDG